MTLLVHFSIIWICYFKWQWTPSNTFLDQKVYPRVDFKSGPNSGPDRIETIWSGPQFYSDFKKWLENSDQLKNRFFFHSNPYRRAFSYRIRCQKIWTLQIKISLRNPKLSFFIYQKFILWNPKSISPTSNLEVTLAIIRSWLRCEAIINCLK